MEATSSFSALRTWIKDFKLQQDRDPFFEDFPTAIGNQRYYKTQLSRTQSVLLQSDDKFHAFPGLEWKRWKAHKQKSAAGLLSVSLYCS